MQDRSRSKGAERDISRREALGLIGAIGLSTWLGEACGGSGDGAGASSFGPEPSPGASATPAPTPTPAELSCIVTPARTEGPYFVDQSLERSDLTTGAARASVTDGLPLRLEIGVFEVDGATCAPLAGAQVDLWHTDAAGDYSGVEDEVGETFLRGYQVSGDDGAVVFETIYPGWYPGRTVHIHFKVRFFSASGDTTHEFTSQFFFDDALTAAVLAEEPYLSRGAPDTTNETDGIYGASGNELLLALAPRGDGAGYVGRFTIGLELT